MRAPVEYARSGDIQVAYQVTGEGPDLVWAPGTASHLDLDWELAPRARFIETLSTFCRVLRFDKRGTGLSDRPTQAATLEERTDDIRAVMDAAGSERAHVFGVSEGANMACLFAATYPDRTLSLIVWGGQARWIKTDDYPWGLTQAENDEEVERLRRERAGEWYVTGPGAGTGPLDPAMLDWYLRYLRAAGSPAAYAALETMNAQLDTRDILPAIRVPTLVMNRTGDAVANVDAARDLAARIPGARFLEFPGETHSMFFDPEPVLAEMRTFITGAPAPLATTRQLATILFADIVGSTARVAESGDRAWRDLLERYYEAAGQELARYEGHEIDRAGDGLKGIPERRRLFAVVA